MNYEFISTNKSLRALPKDISGSSSSSSAAAEDLRNQEQRTETGGFSLLGKRPAKTITMPKTEEDKSKKISKPLKEENGENKGRK